MQMAEQGINEVVGELILVQEDRFRMQTKDGRSLLLIMGKGIGETLEDMQSMAERGEEVTVRYRGEPEAGAVAVSVQVH